MYKIAPLIINSGQKSGSTNDVFIAQPDSHKESLAGRLFVMAEVENNRSESLKLISFLINNINTNYYQNEKIILRERLLTLKVEHIFESALAKTNKELAEFIKDEKISLPPEALNITIGVIYEDSLHFAITGKNKAMLIYRDNSRDAAGEKLYKTADIAKQSKGPSARDENEKIFPSVISGQIPTNSYFIFSNEALPEYVSNKQLIDIVTTLPPASAVEQIKNTISEINSFVSFLGIIIKNSAFAEPEPTASQTSPKTMGGKDSISELKSTEDSTERLLAPTGLIDFVKWTTSAKLFISGLVRGKKQAAIKPLDLKDKIFIRKKATLFSLSKARSMIADASKLFINVAIHIAKLFSDKEKLSGSVGQMNIDLKTKILDKVAALKNLSKKRKVLLGIFLLCAILLAQNLIVTRFKNKQIADINQYNELISTIEKKENQIDANLLYNNNEGAEKLSEEIPGLLSQLPQDTEEQRSKYNALNDKLNEQLEKVRKIIRVADPSELANLSALQNDTEPANLAFNPDKSQIFIADPVKGIIFSLGLKDNLVTANAGFAETINALSYPIIDGAGNIIYFNKDSLLSFDPAKKSLTKLKISPTDNLGDGISSAGYFGNRLYLLNSPKGQIYRFAKGNGEYTGGTPWLNKELAPDTAQSISIDGNIYVLSANCTMEEYLSGQKQEFSLSSINPKMESCDKLIVTTEKKYVYILDKAGKRIIVFALDGKYLAQYTSDKWNGLRDFIVDEDRKFIYVLDGKSVYSFSPTHLN